MSEQPLPLPELSPLPWAIDPDDREGMEWNVHIVERDRSYMRVCFMSNCSQAEINAAFIVKAVNHHDALVKALRLARKRIEYLGAACNDPKHFEANDSTYLPAIDEVLGAVGSSGGDK